jgi:tetratricopeptide (TPR) repeat protein/SAM-dependent methyltransferase
MSVEQSLRKAKRHAKNGETSLAAEQYKNILKKYPQNKQAIIGLRKLQQPKASTSTSPPQERMDDLVLLYNQGKFQQVLDHGGALEQQFPETPFIPNLLGVANTSLKRLEQAIVKYSRALQIKPDYAEAHNNLGVALHELGKFDQAVVSYRKALHIKPDYAEAHSNLGATLHELGKFDQAVVSCKKALHIKPDYAEAHSNLGNALDGLGKTLEAITHYRESVLLAPDRKEFWQNFSWYLRTVSFETYDEQWASIYLSLLSKKTSIRPKQVVKPILNLLKQHPSIQKAMQILNSGDIQEASLDICNSLSDIPLFLLIIELSPVLDLDFEKLLRAIRSTLLLDGGVVIEKQRVLKFQISLALHCFTNEYVFGETDEETSAVQALDADIDRIIADKGEPNPLAIACLGSYRPLHKFEWSQQLMVPESLTELFQRQVKDVDEEIQIRSTIRTLANINNQVSKAVQAQYEENPYPRWINTGLPAKPTAIPVFAKTIELKLSANTRNFTDRPEILVAGCGTGQHAITTATTFLNSKVLAIDLSLSSLSYAIRKTRELGITNIEFLQADILDLDSMDSQFDLIESVGVLHHLADPLAGWKILVDRLKPGGLMKIGLYSEFARQHIVAARQLILEMGLSNTTQDILKFRSAVLDVEGKLFSKFGRLIDFNDFFSTSELRDLLFHVQEHHFTLPKIKENLQVLGLTFVGFEFTNKNIKTKFVREYSDPLSVYSLDAWHEFELANVDIFAGMYQFWVQKKAIL